MSGEAALAELEAADADTGAALFAAVREPWLCRALLAYHARTGSARALALLAAAPEPHARHLLDALRDMLREPRDAPAALAALAALLAARPAWLPRLPGHALCRELPRAAARAAAPADLLHALLALAALAAAAPAALPPAAAAPALLRPARLPPPAPAAAAQLALAQRALFHALYATAPAALLHALRAELAAGGAGLAAALRPLLRSVRLHPALLAPDEPQRWAARDAHDVLAEAQRLVLPAPPAPRPAASPPPAAPPSPPASPPASPAAPEQWAAEDAELWPALGELCGEDSAPATPLPPEEPGEPEAAVEATPENTPASDARAMFRFPADSGAVRVIGRHSQPASPLRRDPSPPAAGDALAGRLARVASERRAAMSPVAFGGAAPAGLARPQPRPPAPRAPSPASPPARPAPARALLPGRAARTGRATRERAASCPPAPGRASVGVQTDDGWPAPAALLLEDYYRELPADPPLPDTDDEIVEPTEQLDRCLRELYEGGAGAGATGQGAGATGPGGDAAVLAEQLRMAHAALQYERWRRDAHAERNRRLLGRVRRARASELAAAALRDHLRSALLERDALRARRPAPAAAPPAAPAPPPDLPAERDARLRAEAALAQQAAELADTRRELQRARADALDAARHCDALRAAAASAARRADHVRRLRRELLQAAEREARLLAAARAPQPAPPPAPPPPAQRALRAALTRVEAELEAAATRADAAGARAAELEATLAARDAALLEWKRAVRAAAEDAAARARAQDDKLRALRRAARTAAAAGLTAAALPDRLRLLPAGPPEPADDPDELPSFAPDA